MASRITSFGVERLGARARSRPSGARAGPGRGCPSSRRCAPACRSGRRSRSWSANWVSRLLPRPTLPGLMRYLASASAQSGCSLSSLWPLKWKSPTSGTLQPELRRARSRIAARRRRPRRVLTVMRTSSEPARASARDLRAVASTSAVSVLVMDCTTTGWPPPTVDRPDADGEGGAARTGTGRNGVLVRVRSDLRGRCWLRPPAPASDPAGRAPGGRCSGRRPGRLTSSDRAVAEAARRPPAGLG